jgi:hypothetical protein
VKVALKYCGGCDPAYDRAEYFAKIAAAAGGSIQWVRRDDPEHRAILLICGCARACPTEELSDDRPVICLKEDRTPPAEVVSLLIDKGKT